MCKLTKYHLRLLSVISWFTILLSFSLILLVIFWLFYPYKPIKFESKYLETPQVVKRGDYIKYNFKYCLYTKIAPEVRREFIDGIILSSSDTKAKIIPGCHTANVIQKVPEGLPPGKYTFRVTVMYKMNPLRTITYINETNSFQVIE